MKRLALVLVLATACASINPSVQKQLDNTQAALNASCATVTQADPDWLAEACKSGLHAVLAGQAAAANDPAGAQLHLDAAVRALAAVEATR